MIKFNIEVKKEGFNVKIGHIAVSTDDMETSIKFYELFIFQPQSSFDYE